MGQIDPKPTLAQGTRRQILFASRWGKVELLRAVLSEKASAPTKGRPRKRWGLHAYFTSSVIETCNECSMQDYHH